MAGLLAPFAGAIDPVITGVINVKNYGAKGNGVFDDTAAIEAAADAAFGSDLALYFPPGSYIYNGNGLAPGQSWIVYGDNPLTTSITIADDIYCVDSAGPFNSITFSGLTILGGAGAIRSTSTAVLVGSKKLINNCIFDGYTVCAISNNAADNPFWNIYNCRFIAQDSLTTIGIAFSTNSDSSNIYNNFFERNNVHIKLNKSGYVRVYENDFEQFDSGTNRICIWVTGNTSSDIIDVFGNKFGNENAASSDLKCAVLAELTGTYNGDRLPDFSSTTITGTHKFEIHNNLINGVPSGSAIVYTRGLGLRGTTVRDNYLGGTKPSYIIQYDGFTIDDSLGLLEQLLCGDNYSEEALTSGPILFTNVGYYGYIDDPRQMMEGDSRNPKMYMGGGQSQAGYVQLLSTRINSFSLSAASKLGNIIDATGGSEAAEFSFNGAASQVYSTLAVAPTDGQCTWLECDLLAGAASPLSVIKLVIEDVGVSGKFYFERILNIPSTWQSFAFPLSITGAETVQVSFWSLDAGHLKIGRARYYQSRERQAIGASTFEQLNMSNLPTSSAGLPSGWLWVDGASGNVIKRA